jgi:hypothetical protein
MAKRHNKTGRSATERFVALPHYLIGSHAWRSLSPVARCVFIELAVLYNGANNGRLALSARDAAERVNCSKDTAARAFLQLQQRGFIECLRRGRFDRKTPHAAEYRLTLHPCDTTGELASKRFMSWRPEEQKFVTGLMTGTAGLTPGTVQAPAQENCRELSLSSDRKGHFGPFSGPTTGTHIIYQGGRDEKSPH